MARNIQVHGEIEASRGFTFCTSQAWCKFHFDQVLLMLIMSESVRNQVRFHDFDKFSC